MNVYSDTKWKTNIKNSLYWFYVQNMLVYTPKTKALTKNYNNILSTCMHIGIQINKREHLFTNTSVSIVKSSTIQVYKQTSTHLLKTERSTNTNQLLVSKEWVKTLNLIVSSSLF